MNKNELVKNLKKEIQDIYSKINEFENSEQIHLIDIDLALSKVRNLYELLSKLNSFESHNTEFQKEEISTITKQDERKREKEESVEIKKEIIKTKEVDESPESKTIVENSVQEPELIIETPSKEKIIIEESPINNAEDTTIEDKEEVSPEIIADKFQSKKFIHDNIAKKNVKKDVSTKMQSKPIKDINAAIGLNDKFIFIRELFGGDKEHYHETIQILNNFDTFENALEFLNQNFDWDEDDENVIRLRELVSRKYS